MRFSRLFISILTLGLAALPVQAELINASFHKGGGTFFNFSRATGWAFTPTTDIVVSQLGIFDADQDGLAESHNVGLFLLADGTPLATTTISSGFGSPLVGDSRFEPVDPVALTAGTDYYLLADNNDIDQYVFGDGAVGYAPEITWLGFGDSSSDSIFDTFTLLGGQPGNLGPNFQYVPAPGGLLLLIVAGACRTSRRRRG
jgi:hypothetical protein